MEYLRSLEQETDFIQRDIFQMDDDIIKPFNFSKEQTQIQLNTHNQPPQNFQQLEYPSIDANFDKMVSETASLTNQSGKNSLCHETVFTISKPSYQQPQGISRKAILKQKRIRQKEIVRKMKLRKQKMKEKVSKKESKKSDQVSAKKKLKSIKKELYQLNPNFQNLSDEEQKLLIKKQRNRQAAQESRDKKKFELKNLKTKLQDTLNENNELQKSLDQYIKQNQQFKSYGHNSTSFFESVFKCCKCGSLNVINQAQELLSDAGNENFQFVKSRKSSFNLNFGFIALLATILLISGAQTENKTKSIERILDQVEQIKLDDITSTVKHIETLKLNQDIQSIKNNDLNIEQLEELTQQIQKKVNLITEPITQLKEEIDNKILEEQQTEISQTENECKAFNGITEKLKNLLTSEVIPYIKPRLLEVNLLQNSFDFNRCINWIIISRLKVRMFHLKAKPVKIKSLNFYKNLIILRKEISYLMFLQFIGNSRNNKNWIPFFAQLHFNTRTLQYIFTFFNTIEFKRRFKTFNQQSTSLTPFPKKEYLLIYRRQ